MNFYKGEIGSILIVYSLDYFTLRRVYTKKSSTDCCWFWESLKNYLKDYHQFVRQVQLLLELFVRFVLLLLVCCCCLVCFLGSLGGWTFWSDWTTCPIPCEGRSKSRRRYCVTQFCNGEYYQVNSCEPRDCLGLFVFTFLKFNLICF